MLLVLVPHIHWYYQIHLFYLQVSSFVFSHNQPKMQKSFKKRVFKFEVCIWVHLVAFSCIWIAFSCIRLHWRLVQVALCCICAFSCIRSSSWKQWSNYFYYFESQSLSHQNHSRCPFNISDTRTNKAIQIICRTVIKNILFYAKGFNENLVLINTSRVSFYIHSKHST